MQSTAQLGGTDRQTLCERERHSDVAAVAKYLFGLHAWELCCTTHLAIRSGDIKLCQAV